MLIYGINPVLEALKARRVTRLRATARHDKRIDEIVTLAAKQGIPIDRVDAAALDRATRNAVHQGILAEVADARDFSVRALVEVAGTAGASHPPQQAPLIVVLDGIEDPHNVGAILRTCDAAGVSGVVRQERHAASHVRRIAPTLCGSSMPSRTTINGGWHFRWLAPEVPAT